MEGEKQILNEVFHVMDRSGTGFLTTDDVKQVLVLYGVILSDSELAAMVHEADVDNDGKLSLIEFYNLMS